MFSSLPPWPQGVDLRRLDAVDSTNAEGARVAAGLSGPTWIVARRQSAGRGRQGRPWQHPAGNFAATLVLPVAGGPQQAAWRSFTAALALAEAVEALAGPQPGLGLKWPNDVLLDGGKLAGILLETAGPRGDRLLVGIGVNLIAAPPIDPDAPAAFPPVALAEAVGCLATPDQLLDALAPAMAAWETQLAQTGFDPVRRAFLARAVHHGGTITARTGTRALTGRFEDIDATGALVLATAQGRVSLAAADVFF